MKDLDLHQFMVDYLEKDSTIVVDANWLQAKLRDYENQILELNLEKNRNNKQLRALASKLSNLEYDLMTATASYRLNVKG